MIAWQRYRKTFRGKYFHYYCASLSISLILLSLLETFIHDYVIMKFIFKLGVLRFLLLFVILLTCTLGNYALFSYNTSFEIRLLNIIGSSIGVMLVFTLLLDITMLLVIQRHIPNNVNWKYRALTQTISLILILISWGPYITLMLRP